MTYILLFYKKDCFEQYTCAIINGQIHHMGFCQMHPLVHPENEWGKTFLYYKTLKKVSKNNCSNLAPYLKGTCNSSYLVNVSENSGGTYTSSDYYIYGLFTLNDSSEYLIPLKKFKSDTEGRNYSDNFESK